MGAKAKVLIAGDSARTCLILKELLLNNGYEVAAEVVNGSGAVDLYAELRPDVIILDVSMPDMDGAGVLRRIKSVSPQAKVIMLSAMWQQNKVIEAMRAGACEFIIKPVQEKLAVAALEKVLK